MVITGALFFYRFLFCKKSVSYEKIPPAEWRIDFFYPSAGNASLPEGWKIVKKPGTKPSIFSLEKDGKDGHYFLRMKSDKASASLVTKADDVDLNKTPILRWSWRVDKFPKGADGRVKAKDDQAIGIYVGTGSPLNNKSISYRFDTETPKGSEGSALYAMGAIKVKWYTLRNKKDSKNGEWFTEERNVAEDFKKAWGFIPVSVYISVACNSQYTASEAGADLDWIEFIK